jgi:hypothetical protein
MARMSFEQRKAELTAMLRRGDTDGIFAAYQGSPLNGLCPPVGMLFSQMIERVLEREYPEEYARSQT